MLLIGAASPTKLFPGGEEKAGYQRKDQLAVDECKTIELKAPPLAQFIAGYYCEVCGIGFAADGIANGPIWPSRN